ncbi:hypothetical protein B0H10DRAFT_378099 [Mycena sp. CBHHK59/15]|nr:hypothetical protein B0H10DRAFT_378099 [Mycena sp. CBHHK59/15]
MIGADPSQFYDTERFTLPTPLQNPESLTSLQTLILGEFLNSSEPFRFNAIAPIPASPGSLPSTPSRLSFTSDMGSTGPHAGIPVSPKSPSWRVTTPPPPVGPPVEKTVPSSPHNKNRTGKRAKNEVASEETAAKEDTRRKRRRRVC